MMAFLVTMPISIRMPITTGMLIGLLVSSSAATTPPIDSGSDSRMVIGWKTLRNSRTRTPSTISRPAPMASAKPVEHLAHDLGVAAFWMRTPGGSFCASGSVDDLLARASPSA